MRRTLALQKRTVVTTKAGLSSNTTWTYNVAKIKGHAWKHWSRNLPVLAGANASVSAVAKERHLSNHQLALWGASTSAKCRAHFRWLNTRTTPSTWRGISPMNKKIAHQLTTRCRELTDYITSSRICRKEITRRGPLGTNLSLNMNSVRFPSRKVKTQREISCPAI